MLLLEQKIAPNHTGHDAHIGHDDPDTLDDDVEWIVGASQELLVLAAEAARARHHLIVVML